MSKVLLYFVTNEAPKLIVADKIQAILLMYGKPKRNKVLNLKYKFVFKSRPF